MKRVFIMLLDSFGIGSSKDSDKFGDLGSNTFGNIVKMCFLERASIGRSGMIKIPNLMSLGLGHLFEKVTGSFPIGISKTNTVIGSYGYASSISKGKDTISGHWEIAGVPIVNDWLYFKNLNDSFPNSLLDEIIKTSSLLGCLGNCHDSGTEIIKKLGLEHIKTKKPIFYTSADSVFQVACHEEIYGLNNLYRLCQSIRNILNQKKYNVARVIARPFIGNTSHNFLRTKNRKDFSLPPTDITVMQKLIIEKQGIVIGIGKVSDVFSGIGFSKSIQSVGLQDLFDKTIKEIKLSSDNSIIFTNFLDFDSLWGHRRDVAGYAKGLEYFDSNIPRLLKVLKNDDLLIITADHGCDPTWKGTDHTREFIPILIYKHGMKSKFLGYRKTFSDISQTISKYFNLSKMSYGNAML